MASLTVSSTNITCSLPASGSGTPGWVWAIVGVAAALVLAAAAAAALVWRRRRRRAAQPQPVLPLAGKPASYEDTPDSEEERGARASSDGVPSPLALHQQLGSALASHNGIPTPGGSTISQAPSMGVHEALWRSKVGFIEGLQIGGMIGRGGFAEVYRGEAWHMAGAVRRAARAGAGEGAGARAGRGTKRSLGPRCAQAPGTARPSRSRWCARTWSQGTSWTCRASRCCPCLWPTQTC